MPRGQRAVIAGLLRGEGPGPVCSVQWVPSHTHPPAGSWNVPPKFPPPNSTTSPPTPAIPAKLRAGGASAGDICVQSVPSQTQVSSTLSQSLVDGEITSPPNRTILPSYPAATAPRRAEGECAGESCVQLDPSNSFAGILRLSDTNFRGTGQTLSGNFIQSIQGTGPSVDLDYVNPFLDSLDTTLRFSVYSRLVFRFSNIFSSSSPTGGSDQYNERHSGVSLGVSRPVNDTTSIGISARLENVKTNNVETTIADQFVQQDGDVAIGTLGFVRNRRDRDQDATRGELADMRNSS